MSHLAAETVHDGGGLAEFYASANRARAKLINNPFGPKVEACLSKLPVKLRRQIKRILRQTARGDGLPHPLGWAEATREMLLGAILAVICACLDYGIDVDRIAVLATPDAIAAIEARIAEKRWSPANAARLLKAIRTLHRAIHHRCPELVGMRARFWGKKPRADKWDRVFPTGEYVRGAYVLAGMARVLNAAGRTRGLTLGRDAGLLAFEAEAALRLDEMHRVKVRDVRAKRTLSGRLILEVDVRMRKVHRDRIARVFDPRTIELMAPLLAADPDAPLARTVDGNGMTRHALAVVLVRTGELAVGKKAGANILRRAGVHGAFTDEQRRKRLAHSKGSSSTALYIPPRAAFGIGLIHAASAASAAKGVHAETASQG